MKKHKNKKNPKNMTNKDRVLSKFTTGRTKAIKKRKNTLLLEYKLQNKVNKFYDRRIGEKNRGMTAGDKVMARFVAQRVKASKKEIYNLGGDEEILTHQGRSVLDVEKFDNPADESDDEDGKLDANFVKEAHFGGGLFTKVEPSSSSHLSTIDRLIAESKKKKAERQQTKEETQNLTDKLDKDLKDLFPLVADSKKSDDEFKPNKESYDVLVRELKFEPVGRPSDKLKSEEQSRKEEMQRLQKLEEERLLRMKRTVESTPDDEEPPQKKHQSADDLDDGFDLDVFDEEEENEDENNDDDDDEDENEDNEDEDEGSEKESNNERVDETVNKPPIVKSKCLVPENLEKLKNFLTEGDTDKKIDLIKEAVRKQQVHTGASNVDHLTTFFRVLLEYVDEIFVTGEDKQCWNFASKLAPILFDLVQVSGDKAAQIVLDIVKTKYKKFSSNIKQGTTPDMLIILKLIPILFPTSDYYHPVATPATAFLVYVISQNSCKNGQVISQGLFLATVVLEYISLSNRYCPEAINFLKGVLYTAVPNTKEAIPPVNSKNKILTLKKSHKKDMTVQDLQLSYANITDECDMKDEDKLKLIYTSLKLLAAYVKHYEHLPAAYAIWNPILKQLDQLPVTSYPKCFVDEVFELKTKISDMLKRQLQYLMAERKRPKALRLYEPNIRQVIDGQSFRTTSQEKLEREKLLHQYKREMKGAIREIRKDRNFLARVKLSEQAQKDAERRAKVKQIFNWGQTQQSELKRMERQNRYRH